jgi:hypothetical protein
MCILGILLAIHGNLKGVKYIYLIYMSYIYIYIYIYNLFLIFLILRILFTLIYLFLYFGVCNNRLEILVSYWILDPNTIFFVCQLQANVFILKLSSLQNR